VQIPRDTIEQIRDRVAIVDVVSQVVTLRRKGGSLVGLCPFHQEKTPSFNVVPAKGIYHCFGCGEGGDLFAFVQKTKGMSFVEAVRDLADMAGVTIPEPQLEPDQVRNLHVRAGLYEVCRLAKEYFRSVLRTQKAGVKALSYLRDRGITDKTIDTFGIGYAPDRWDGLVSAMHREGISLEQLVDAGLARWREPGNAQRGGYDLFRGRIIIPIMDRRGRTIAFGGRLLSSDPSAPKYVNSPETDIYKKSKTLYGLSHGRSAIQRKNRMLVVEGYFDVISLHQAGLEEVVATCGTALTAEHLQAIRTLTSSVIVMFDSDEAGMRAAERSMDLFLSCELEPLRLDLGESKDPDEFIRENSVEALDALLARAEPLFDLVIRRVLTRCGNTPGGRQQAVDQLAPLVRRFASGTRDIWIGRVAGLLDVNERSIRERVGASRRGDSGRQEAVAPPLRWVPSGRLRTLLWLLLHQLNEVRQDLLAFEHPEWLTSHPEALRAIGLLLKGTELTELVEIIDDPDVVRVLMMEAARDLEYQPQQAMREVKSFLNDLELRYLQSQLVTLRETLSGLNPQESGQYLSVLKEKQEIQNRLDALKKWRRAQSD